MKCTKIEQETLECDQNGQFNKNLKEQLEYANGNAPPIYRVSQIALPVGPHTGKVIGRQYDIGTGAIC